MLAGSPGSTIQKAATTVGIRSNSAREVRLTEQRFDIGQRSVERDLLVQVVGLGNLCAGIGCGQQPLPLLLVRAHPREQQTWRWIRC
jgi:hypothetical protein